MKKILIILVLIITGCSNNTTYTNIDSKEAIKKINNGAVIIDVRTAEEYTKEHIKGSINIPLDKIEDIKKFKNKEIIVYCKSGARSKKASEQLIKLGLENVYNLKDGITSWNYDKE